MTYKEKHWHQAFGALALATLMVLPSACTNQKEEKSTEREPLGLLNPKPYITSDKYGERVVLYHVDIPIYDKNGERKKDQYVLTRGLKKSKYQSDNEKHIMGAYINDSPALSYVEVDGNNAVYTQRGFVGLFVDWDNKLVVVADNRVSDFTRKLNQKRSAMRISDTPKKERNTKPISITDTEETSLTIIPDTLNDEPILFPSDTLNNGGVLKNEDISNKDTVKTEETFHMDTLNITRREERE